MKEEEDKSTKGRGPWSWAEASRQCSIIDPMDDNKSLRVTIPLPEEPTLRQEMLDLASELA
jgi:hypothetical protein